MPRHFERPNFPIDCHVRLGICRRDECSRKGTFGPLKTRCPGNHKYPTQATEHYFECIATDDEKGLANDADLVDVIGVCKVRHCFSA